MTGQRGSALVEAVVLGLLLMAPVLWVVVVAEEIQRVGTATSTAAREVANAAARNAGELTDQILQEALAMAFANEDLDHAAADVRLESLRDPILGRIVQVQVSYPVSLIAVPFSETAGMPLHVKSTYTSVVHAVP